MTRPEGTDVCATCEGRGGEAEHDMQGDGVWMSPVTYIVPCADCIEAGICPDCSTAISDSALDVDTFQCPVCDWQIDYERLDDQHYEP